MAQTLLESWRSGRLGKAGKKENVIFSQVQEDANTELSIAKQLNADKIFVIASGGCTALSLLALEPKHLLACDINPAQVALLELKRLALQDDVNSAVHHFYNDATPLYNQHHAGLSITTQAHWLDNTNSLKHGLNRLGTIDRKLRQAIQLFHTFIHPKKHVRQMLNFTNLDLQKQYYTMTWDNWRWKACFSLAKRFLPVVYSRTILDKLPDEFIEDIKQQVEHTLQSSPSVNNPYLWQIFLPQKMPQESHLPIYLQAENYVKLQHSLATMHSQVGDAAEVIRNSKEKFNFFALSNILELNEGYAAELAEAIFENAELGAGIILRFIFEPQGGELEPFKQYFQYEAELSEEVRNTDRGLFCKHIFVFLNFRSTE